MKAKIKKLLSYIRYPSSLMRQLRVVLADRKTVRMELIEKTCRLELFDEAIQLGLFDIVWYEAHCGKFDSPLSAFEDYLAKSSFSNVNPSAEFDTEFYHRVHPDVYHGGISPLLHYLEKGGSEKRKLAAAHLRWHAADELLPVDQPGWADQKIAICLHIYYADFVEKFAQCLRQFPCNVDVFVAVGSEDIKQHALAVYGQIGQVKSLKVVLAPNRGRNFGPLLVEFGKDLLNYDLMCHLHSKKSLYSGREQTQWFDYLNQYLFKDKHVVACILRLFENKPELGMYYPTSFWMMPSWVNNWTCNKSFAQGFVKDWEIDISKNFVNYPVGGMFWARPKALKQLLETDFSYDDFPSEPLPNDGSWLHALERSVGLLAEKNGYSQFYYYPAAARFTQDGSYIFANYVKTPEQLLSELRNFHIVSFDVFDTVLRREYTQPDYAKYRLGEYLTQQSIVSSPQQFIELRNGAELELRKESNFQGDVSIVDVYEKLAEYFVCDPEQTKSFLQMEFNFDLEQILAKDEMVSLVHALADMGRDIWFISDSYYTHQQVETMLKKVGLSMPFRLFVSSDLGLRKDNGTMWRLIKDLLDQQKLSHIHIGDNVRSDAQLCGDYGLSNMHVLHPVDKWQAAGFKPELEHEGDFDVANMYKWGKLVGNLGRYPFFGE